MLAISDCSIRVVDTLCLTVLLEYFLINDLRMLLVPADIVVINEGESEFHVWPLLIRMKSLILKNN